MRKDRAEFALDVLDALPGPGERPTWTSMLALRWDLGPVQQSTLLYTVLRDLARRGLVERIRYDWSDCAHWRLTGRGAGGVTVEMLRRAWRPGLTGGGGGMVGSP